MLESAKCNLTHGDRLNPKDKKRVARDMAASDTECKWTEEALAEKLRVIRQTLNTWISDIRARQRAGRNINIIRLNRFGWTQEQIAHIVGMSQNRISEIIGNANFSEIDNLLSQGRDMNYIAGHYHLDLALAWALRLEGKADQEKFKELGWGLRTWDLWNFNECDARFGDEWPGRIPAQLIGHILYYFSEQNELVFDPMGGGGVTPDTCLAFNRRCWTLDMIDRPDKRPEIEPFYWELNGNNNLGVLSAKEKPDLIIFDPPYFDKKAEEYAQKSISMLPREKYLNFFERFFALLRHHTKTSTTLAFINADWRDFQHKPATCEIAEDSILVDDYLKILEKTGWLRTHIIQAPLSSERFEAGVVSAMQKKKILGVTSRYVIILNQAGFIPR